MRKFFRLKCILSMVAGPVFVTMPAIGMEGHGDAAKSGNTMHVVNEHAMGGGKFDRDQALKISSAAIGNKLPDYSFTDSTGQPVSLSDFSGRPILINLIYTSCMHTCPLIVETLARSVKVARDALGDDSFTVLTIGFDTRNDSVKRMRTYAKDRGVGDDNWLLLSGDEATITALTSDLGFQYRAAPYGFDHLAQVSVIDESSVVYRQIYGVKLTAPVVVEPLKQLVFGRKTGYTSFSGLANQVRLFCTIYDPNTGRYRFDFSFIISVFMGLTFLLGAGVLFVRTWISIRDREGSA